MSRLRLCCLLLSILLFALPGVCHANRQQPVVADLSKHLVAINAGFSGTDVLLFGATDGPGDIVLVVRGPPQQQIVRRKTKSGPIWINGESVLFDSVPAFYLVASSAPLEEILPDSVRRLHQIGLSYLNLEVLEPVTEDAHMTEPFRQALVRLKVQRGVYLTTVGTIDHMANRLFRSELQFPSNVPTGTYMVEVYLVRDRRVVSAEITPLSISRAGLGAEIFLFAHDHAVLYGVLAILAAAGAGWFATLVFRRN
ncbi:MULTISPECIES: TIGR02186 family protein [unclassified Haematospirillum]|uniref:TIGR02186 family protein n=1 Tax=unclassified Haematospirillum TaxID=2622088 RepID=UPI00143904FE|nr:MULTISPECIES: TIGR02186 family protein [unclassified Haematospirillum]NKD55684.1 hypothetical protein [Haematospirillum sp. H4890]NKD75209.1 hypothetical protein [Haematospirillum sp. H4485]